jgi:GST-like protein
MASYPWIIPDRQGQDIDEFPNLKRWKAAIRARPATERAYAKAKEVNPSPSSIRTEAERKILFGQDKSVVK